MSAYKGPYPCPEVIYYGVPVWTLGEDGEQFIAGGHGRRAAAALSALIRFQLGRGWCQSLRSLSRDGKASGPATAEKWAVFHEECGCTVEQHAAHREAARGAAGPGHEHRAFTEDILEACAEADCDFPGLPPCHDDEGPPWCVTVSSGLEPEDGLLPVTWVTL